MHLRSKFFLRNPGLDPYHFSAKTIGGIQKKKQKKRDKKKPLYLYRNTVMSSACNYTASLEPGKRGGFGGRQVANPWKKDLP